MERSELKKCSYLNKNCTNLKEGDKLLVHKGLDSEGNPIREFYEKEFYKYSKYGEALVRNKDVENSLYPISTSLSLYHYFKHLDKQKEN